MYALQDSELRTQVAGVVCMATPFLVATQTYVGRSYLGLNYENYNIFPSFIPLIALTALLAMALMVFYNWPTYFAFLAVFFFLVIMSPLWFVVIEYVADKYDHFSFKISQEMELPSLGQLKMLILRSPGDEASVTLAFAQFLCWLVLQIFAIIKVIVECLSRMLHGWSRSIVLMGLTFVITVVLEIFLGVFHLIYPNDLGIY